MIQLYTEQHGNPANPALVMLHGWGMNSSIWLNVLPALEEHFSITLIDLPGLGQSPALDRLTFDAAVDALLAAAPKRAHWLGWSLGGQLAVAAAAKAPGRVSALVMVASNPCFVARDDWVSAMDTETYQGFKGSLADNPAKTLTRFIMLQTQGAEAGRDSLKMLKQLLKEDRPSALAPALTLLETDARDALVELEIPVLLQFGEKDLLVPVSAVEGCAALNAEAKTAVYEGAGHLPFISHTSRWCDDVIAFLSGAHV
ncbi:pimeloyl-ACP methyl ester esterase BioH [Pontibacterium granulatum]|uniref:pimeloyl-ACP methyl ester esterase BioH n=1 Tax=Pontibacterium granulatum TaxID=2036029 RepID=UPI00249BF281|nr:pimeloyl-ACP methyl ester esterase BioH [Pontibacterium granulatum]MDI3322788.1 pimeloyl-ACP methyl ester esterase BioH [Pontibacterium granulatum]